MSSQLLFAAQTMRDRAGGPSLRYFVGGTSIGNYFSDTSRSKQWTLCVIMFRHFQSVSLSCNKRHCMRIPPVWLFDYTYSSSSRLDPARPCSCMLPLPVLSSSAGPSSQELTRTGWDMLASRTVPDGKSEANHDYVHTWSKAEEYRALFTLCFLVQT